MTIETTDPTPSASLARFQGEPSATTMSLVQWAQEAEAAYTLAQNLCNTPFAAAWKGDPYGAAAAILRGSEVGLSPVTSLSAFDNIQGQPAPKAITLRALVQSHGHDLEILEETPERAVARYRRNGAGEWRTTDFTIEDARAMKLLGKANWQNQPRAMLVARVTSKAARMVASDVILGIGYSSEELYDESPTRHTVTATPDAPAADRMAAMLRTETSDPDPVVDNAAESPASDQRAADEPSGSEPDEDGTRLLSNRTKFGRLFYARMSERAFDSDQERIEYMSETVGRLVTSSKELTEDEGRKILARLDDEAGVQEAEVVS